MIKSKHMLDVLFSNPVEFLILAGILVISLTVHEFAHAFAAYKLGDPTAKYMGRLTLNPLAHLDPVGSIMLLVAGFGWGKPVPINTANFKNPRRDAAMTALAGPLSNVLIAVVFALLVHLFGSANPLSAFLVRVIIFNLTLAIFNLLPVFPLDGFNVVYGILPLELAWQWQETQRYGIFILLILIVTGSTGFFIFPLMNISLKLLGF